MARRTLPIFKNLTHRPTPAPFLPKPDPNTRSVTYMPRPGDGAPWPVTLIPGDGIGPLVTNAVEQVMEVMHAPVYFERYDVHDDMKRVAPEVIESIRKNKVCLKGGLKTLVGGGVSSLNVQLRKKLDLYVQRRREREERSTGVIREPGIGQRNSVGDCGFEVSDGSADDNL